MKPRLLVIAIAVLLAGGIGFLAGRGGSPAMPTQIPDEPTGSMPDGDTAAPAQAARDTAGVRSTDHTVPLPDVGTPLAQIHDTLVRRAAAGEARAACRLAAEHERCEMERVHLRSLGVQTQQLEDLVTRGSDLQPDDAQRRLTQRREALEQQLRDKQASVAQCDAVAPLAPEARARYWRQAALAGHVPSMRHYAIGNAFRWHDLMDALPALQTYRRDAEGIASRAAMQGDAASAYALAMAYADSDGGHWRPFLAQAITPDLTQALAWFSVLARHPDIAKFPTDHPTARSIARHLATLQAAASPTETAQAARFAERVVIPAASDPSAGAMIRPDGGAGDIAPDACAEDRFAGPESSRTTS